MTKSFPSFAFSLIVLVGIMQAGCKQLQPGYYLTPENYPTQRPSGTVTQQIIEVTATPVSTVNPVMDITDTPFPTPTPSPVFTATSETFTCNELQGTITEQSFISTTTGKEFHYRIYLPPCYSQTKKRYPYLIMLHGLVPGSTIMNDDQWVRLGLTDAADKGYLSSTLPPMIIVMPDGNDALHGNDDSPFAAMIVSELLPQIEGRFCAWGTPQSRAIGGLSRGGFWAFSVAMLHPELFSRVGGHSPFLYDGDYKVYNPYNLVDAAEGIKDLTYYIDYGAQDYVADGVKGFVKKLNKRGIEPTLVVNSTGAHTEDYWASHVSEYLGFYGETWPKDVSILPDCNDILASATPEN